MTSFVWCGGKSCLSKVENDESMRADLISFHKQLFCYFDPKLSQTDISDNHLFFLLEN